MVFSLFNRAPRKIDEVVKVAEDFIAPCIAMAGDELIRVADNATGVLGFSYGVIEAMAHRANLSNDDSFEALRRYLSKVFGGDAAQVEKALSAIRDIPKDPKWARSIELGGQTALSFLAGEFAYPPAAFGALGIMLTGTPRAL